MKNSNMNTLLMALWAILMAFKDDLDVDVMNTIMQSIGAASGLSAGFGPLAAGNVHPESTAGPSEYVYGIRGLADYLGVSDPTAQKYVNAGKLDPAIRRVGKKYSFLKSKVDEIFANK
jgi:hypothetical protein